MISVIINVYNDEKHIKKCLDCVINQTYKDLEIIIVNDGSTDQTLSICKEYNDERIKIINQENMGLSLARNVGIDNANGEYLFFIDSDDVMDLDNIEYLYNLCKKYNTKISTGKSIKVYDYNWQIKKSREHVEVLSSKEMLDKILLCKDNAVTIWNKLIKKDLFDNARFQDRVANDVVVTYKLAIQAENIAYSNQIKYYYLSNNEGISISKNENYDRSIDIYKASLERYKYIKNIYPNFIENEIGMMIVIARLYLRKNPDILNFLQENSTLKLYKQLFSIKIFKAKLGFREKIKLLLFRISPKIYKKIIFSYLQIKRNLK